MRGRRQIVVQVAGAMAIAVISASAAAWATGSTRFSDVPETHPFFEQIEALRDACITQGFDDGTFRPANNITRQAEAAFLARGGATVLTDVWAGPETFGSATPGVATAQDLEGVEHMIPVASSSDDPFSDCSQWVLVEATVGYEAMGTLGSTCHVVATCELIVDLTDQGVRLGEPARGHVRLTTDRQMGTVTASMAVEADAGYHDFGAELTTRDIKSDMLRLFPVNVTITVVPFGFEESPS